MNDRPDLILTDGAEAPFPVAEVIERAAYYSSEALMLAVPGDLKECHPCGCAVGEHIRTQGYIDAEVIDYRPFAVGHDLRLYCEDCWEEAPEGATTHPDNHNHHH